MALKIEIINKVTNLIIAAFGFVAALAWNEAVKSLFAVGGPLYIVSTYGVWVYALFATILAVVVTIWIANFLPDVQIKEYKFDAG